MLIDLVFVTLVTVFGNGCLRQKMLLIYVTLYLPDDGRNRVLYLLPLSSGLNNLPRDLSASPLVFNSLKFFIRGVEPCI